MARLIKVRGHHLLCLLTFRGMGYGPAFVKNFKRIVKNFASHPESVIILTTESDVICSSCPYNKDGRCFKKENSRATTKAHDKRVLKMFGFKEREEVEIHEILDKIKSKISPRNLLKICKKCSWLGHCSNLSEFNFQAPTSRGRRRREDELRSSPRHF